MLTPITSGYDDHETREPIPDRRSEMDAAVSAQLAVRRLLVETQALRRRCQSVALLCPQRSRASVEGAGDWLDNAAQELSEALQASIDDIGAVHERAAHAVQAAG